MLLGVGAKKKTYIDDVFSTYIYDGDGNTGRAINNGIDLAGKGGMVYTKRREANNNSLLQDTERGGTKYLIPSSNGAEGSAGLNTSFNNNGYTLNNTWQSLNNSSGNYVSWTFRKTPGFFDVVTWTGDGTNNRSISHSLGSVPGMIMVKVTSTTDNWLVWHKDLTGSDLLMLDTDDDEGAQVGLGNNPTSTTFTVNNNDKGNGNGQTYVAYLFAGGESTAATARSVDFDGSNDGLSATSSDFVFGTGDFTVECWFRYGGGNTDRIISMDKTSNPTNKWVVYHHQGLVRLNINNSDVFFYGFDQDDTTTWHHLAVVKHNNKTKLYIDGEVKDNQYNPTNNDYSDTLDYQSDQIHIGMNPSGGENFQGNISNVRVVAGTAVYTSSFRPPTKPLENITNTKLLCCNDSSVTGKTVGPTITATDSPTASSDSPFDDPAAFKFGDSQEGIIKCGSYVGNGSSTGPEIDLGWEPQLLITKRIDSSGNWHIYDSMRGIVTGKDDNLLRPNNTDAEEVNVDAYDLTPTGFKVRTSYTHWNADGGSYIFLAIRRPDGYVGKPADAGTDVFAMATGTSGSDVPEFVTGFPVDASFFRIYASQNANWLSSARLTQAYTLQPHDTDAEVNDTNALFDYQNGWGAWTGDLSSYFSWNWKRHAGFDVVTYTGDGVAGRQIPHSLSKTPEMIWVKCRSNAEDGAVFHKGVNGGTNPEQYYMILNTNDAQTDSTNRWNDSAPNSTHFTVGNAGAVNGGGGTYLAMLFASCEGISKVGYYTGTSASTLTITTGFQPRFIIVKRVNNTGHWFTYDTTRGWASGSNNDKALLINTNDYQWDTDFGHPISNGFVLTDDSNEWQNNNDKYIYYAHA